MTTTDPTPRRELPTGTVTFLRTDVEGSMSLVHALGSAWDGVNATHLGMIRRAVDDHGGVTVRTEGDALFAAFPEARAAVVAAVDAQRALQAHAWPIEDGLRVRMGLHSGEAHLAGDDYGGFEVNRAARIANAGHGGQIVLSGSTRALVADALPVGVLCRDLGEHPLKDVPRPERLYQLDIPGLTATFPPLRTSRPELGNLPTRLTTFLGREVELGDLGRLLDAGRLVTLTGPGGIGKTSLGTELARAQAANYRDGAWFVALDGIAQPGLVMTAIARTIGLFDGPERAAADGLLSYAADRSMLIVLDNFEQLLDAGGDVVALLRASPGSRAIVTSRAPLRVAGEQEYPVPPLTGSGVPSSDRPPSEGASPDAAVGLFVDRARAVRPDWEPGADLLVVREICTLLDGLPLGIELAAARVSLLPVAAIRDRLAARLPLPGSGPRGVPARQRTLDAAIAWSYELLSPEHRRLLEDLSIFDGGFDAEQASQVATTDDEAAVDVLDGLMSLGDQSLVGHDPDARSEAMLGNASGIRSRLLKTIQTFALVRLVARGDEAAIRRRHALAFLALAETAAPHLPGADQPRWLDRLGLDHANLGSALRWTIDAGEVDAALRLVAALWRYWQLAGHLVEGADLAQAALALPGAEARTPTRLAAVAAVGGIAYWQGRPHEAVRWYEEQLELAYELIDPAAEADALFNLSYGAVIGGQTDRAYELMEAARRRFVDVGDARGAARTEWSRATVMLNEGRPVDALPVFEAARDRFAALGDAWYHAMALGSIAWVHFAVGDMGVASRWFARSLVEYHALRDVATTVVSLQIGAIVALEAGRPEDAALLLGAMTNLSERYGVEAPAGLVWLMRARSPLDRAAELLGPDVLADALERGRRLTLDDAVELVIRIETELPLSRPSAQ